MPLGPKGRRQPSLVDAALDQALELGGCPLCSLQDRACAGYFRALLWELVTDVGARNKLRASLGLCPRHWWRLRQLERDSLHNALGLAILLEDTVGEVRKLLEEGDFRQRWENRAPCPACEREQQTEATYAGRLQERLETEPHLRRRLCKDHHNLHVPAPGRSLQRSGKLLPIPRGDPSRCPGCGAYEPSERGKGPLPRCIPHLVEEAERGVLEETARQASVRWAEELQTHLRGFIHKQDHQVCEPLTLRERTILDEAVLFLAGGPRVRSAA